MEKEWTSEKKAVAGVDVNVNKAKIIMQFDGYKSLVIVYYQISGCLVHFICANISPTAKFWRERERESFPFRKTEECEIL